MTKSLQFLAPKFPLIPLTHAAPPPPPHTHSHKHTNVYELILFKHQIISKASVRGVSIRVLFLMRLKMQT